MNRKKILLTIVIAVALTGCGKNFLSLAPQSQANQQNFYKTASDFNTAVIGAYSTLTNIPSNIYLEMCGYRSDELFLNAPTSGTQDRYNLDKFVETPANGIITNAWGYYYQSIADCNQIITRIGSAGLADSLTTQYSAEARFLRALNYFDLVRFWGAVPLILTPVTPAQSLTIGRSDTATVYASIEADLTYAVQHLPAAFSGTSLGRATSDAAMTLLGNVYLTEHKYSAAASTLQSVVSGPYQLLPAISSVFSTSNKMNAEIIFAVRYNKDLPNPNSHALWFAVSDTSTSPITPSLLSSYSAADKRKALLYYTKVGNNYVVTKYTDVLSTTTGNAGNDYIVYRFADVLLLYAEAVNETGYDASGTGPAWTSINKVRQRAGLQALTTASVGDQNSFRQAVWNERRWELALEGHRWFDLLRTGTAVTTMLNNEAETMHSFQYIYPLPQQEIEKMGNPAIFSQNPGY